MKAYEYDFAFSFAGEDREYVEEVANNLKNSDIKVFYDVFEQVNLWGKNLYSHLDEVYRNKARFCVIFISEHYRRKNWTNHERESAQTRAFQKNEEYILPARFDNTEIPGVHSTTAYINLLEFSPKQFAQLLIKKLKTIDTDALKIPKTTLKANQSKLPVKASDVNNRKSRQTMIAQHHGISDTSKDSKHKTQTVNFTAEGISQLSNDKPVIYKILTEGKKNNYTGVAKRGEVHKTIQKHLKSGKYYVPGHKVYIERMNSIKEARQKADRIIIRSKPKYNE
ncbi:toll/interleukin-1 receptor domain-containing protein [Dendronalium sp. ChiSLP03b]|uniref:toll/interleukin-1 receptor domain-containing protein n=1 Tax=Dendronalium sp. ChiSLP03b TaxID=3075381 RepID=UPI0039189A2C